MPRQPDVPCSVCGRPMWRGKGCRPPGQGICLTCRRKSPEYQARANKVNWMPEIRTCPTCGSEFQQHRNGQIYCTPEHRPGRSGTKTKSTTERGYGTEHQRQRRRWKPVVAAGQAQCHATTCLMPSRYIDPDEPWHLGHTPDRSAWTGPEHERCNTSEGATRGNRSRGREQVTETLWWQP